MKKKRVHKLGGSVEFRPLLIVLPQSPSSFRVNFDTSSSRSALPRPFSSQEELDNFYDDLYTAMQSNKAHFNIIMGDFKDEEKCLISVFDCGDRNNRVEDLVNFATAKGSLSKVLLVTFTMRKGND